MPRSWVLFKGIILVLIIDVNVCIWLYFLFYFYFKEVEKKTNISKGHFFSEVYSFIYILFTFQLIL